VLSGPLPKGLTPSLKDARADLPASYGDGCHLDFLGTVPGECAYGDPASPTTVVLFGDSHAAQWLPALEQLATERDWRLVSITKSGCPVVDATVWNAPLKRPYRECDTWRKMALDRIAVEYPVLTFVASAREYELVADGHHRPLMATPSAWQDALTRTLQDVMVSSGKVILLADTPILATDPAECLSAHHRVDACPAPSADALDPAYSSLEAAAAEAAGASLVSMNDFICPGDFCPLVVGTTLAFRDEQHLTASYARLLAPWLAAASGDMP
jgi:hypothetical protein